VAEDPVLERRAMSVGMTVVAARIPLLDHHARGTNRTSTAELALPLGQRQMRAFLKPLTE